VDICKINPAFKPYQPTWLCRIISLSAKKRPMKLIKSEKANLRQVKQH